MKPKIILLAGEGDSTNIIFHALQSSFQIEKVIIEESVSKSRFIKRRVKRLGYWEVAGQVLFQGACAPLLKYISTNRRKEIMKQFKMSDDPIPADKVIQVSSVNSRKCIDQIKSINPAVIVVNGTRIISKKVLNCTKGIFINTHAGITPKYRGVHGGYWALANQDHDNCGVTVHLIDAGIDTGSILYQETIEPDLHDNFSTYPLLQLGRGISLMKKAIEDVIKDDVQPKTPKSGESHLWYHPTIWYYLYKLITQGVR